MALPTAATVGYGWYPTLGPTPDVACDCLREWLPVFRRLIRFKGYGDVDVWQCTGGLDASGGTHSRGGAFDYSGTSFSKAMIAREMGAWATWPRAWSGNMHTHGVLHACPHNEPAAYQLAAMRWYRRNGLGYLGLAGPDPLPQPSRYRTWREGIEWAKAQMNTTTTTSTSTSAEEDDLMAVSNEDAARIGKAVADAIFSKSLQVGNDRETFATAEGRERAGQNRIENLLKEILAALQARP